MAPPLEYDTERPWVRQPCDEDTAWAIFSDFLLMGPTRKLTDMAKRWPWTWAMLCQCSFDYGWKERAQAFDRHLDALRLATVERVTEEDAATRARRHGAAARKLILAGELELDKLIRRGQMPGSENMPGVMRPHEAIRAVSLGVRTERLAYGETTEKIETGPDLSGMTLEQLQQLQELQEKAGL